MKKRPAKCRFCRKQMYYFGDKRHVPEAEIVVKSSKLQNNYYFHVHLSCWKAGLSLLKGRDMIRQIKIFSDIEFRGAL